jgi:chorismate dehydratase
MKATGLPSATWISVRTADGSFTLAHPLHGETCHSRAGAWEESRLRYADACRLAERARGERALRLLDVGTGLGLNLAAALEAVQGTDCRLEVLSLELERGVIEAAFALEEREGAGLAPELAAHWSAALLLLREALADPRGRAQGEQVSLTLALGDARETLPRLGAGAFDAVFLDAFSPRVEPELWTPAFLCEIARRIAPGGLLSTYSAALAVRAGLAAAGLRVGPGARVGTKSSGTLASPDLALDPFPARLERRIARRAAALPGNPPATGCSPARMH